MSTQRLEVVYEDGETLIDRTVYAALVAVRTGECPAPSVIAACEMLARLYELRAHEVDCDRGEAFIVVCWEAWTNPPGAVHKN